MASDIVEVCARACEQAADRWPDDRAKYIAHECAKTVRLVVGDRVMLGKYFLRTQLSTRDGLLTEAGHEYPACAVFRGGNKCTCVGQDFEKTDPQSCPHCGSFEWDRVTAERGRERDVPFNRCAHCEREWETKE